MLGYFKGPKLFMGSIDEMKISTGFNTKRNEYFVFITDKKTKITCRVNLTEEQFHNLWNNASFVAKQHDDKQWKSIP